MVALGVRILVFLLGLAVFANYAWHIFSADEKDWQEAKSNDVKEEHEDGVPPRG